MKLSIFVFRMMSPVESPRSISGQQEKLIIQGVPQLCLLMSTLDFAKPWYIFLVGVLLLFRHGYLNGIPQLVTAVNGVYSSGVDISWFVKPMNYTFLPPTQA